MHSPLVPLKVEERWQCRLFVVPFPSPCTANSARALVHVAESVPQVRAVPNVKRKVFGTLKCHEYDTGASGRRVSFKLPRWSSRSRVGSSGSCVTVQAEYSSKGC